MVAGGNAAPGFYDAALLRRQTLMGASGPAALVKNGKVFMIAMFACIGGLLYGLFLSPLNLTQLTRCRLQSRSLFRRLDHAILPETHGQLRLERPSRPDP